MDYDYDWMVSVLFVLSLMKQDSLSFSYLCCNLIYHIHILLSPGKTASLLDPILIPHLICFLESVR